MRAAILLWDDVELLAFAGPAQVFADAGEGGAFYVYTVAGSRHPIVSQSFLEIIPEYSFDECPPPDVIVVPGGGLSYITRRESVLRWIRDASSTARITLSVSSGDRVLAAAGVLNASSEGQRHTPAVAGEAVPARRSRPRYEVREGGKWVHATDPQAAVDAAAYVVARLYGGRSDWG